MADTEDVAEEVAAFRPKRGEVLGSALFAASAGSIVFVGRALWVASSMFGGMSDKGAERAFMMFWGPFVFLLAAGQGVLEGSVTGLLVGLVAGLVVRRARQRKPPDAWTPEVEARASSAARVCIVLAIVGLAAVVPGFVGGPFK
jgi:hypothetical protein